MNDLILLASQAGRANSRRKGVLAPDWVRAAFFSANLGPYSTALRAAAIPYLLRCSRANPAAGGRMTQEQLLREQLAKTLDWGEAHVDFRTALKDFPLDLRGEVPPGFSHSAWELLEHLRIALWDIVEYTRDTRHKSPPWPKGYWPPMPTPPQEEAWDQSVQSLLDSLEDMRALVLDRSLPLLSPLPRSQGQTLLREALLIVDHNAYHLGQLVQLRKALRAWPKDPAK